ncbi:MAG: glycosyltransferase family 2 protein [Verrucomicrobia bacterium]|nr:glycosyltransferase family 2 protein [Verrucomicrobiota bacterium]
MSDANQTGFSLVIPTVKRLQEVRQLFVSIQKSTFRDFEVIVVDQNRSGLLDNLCREFAAFFPLTHLKVELTGAARARNHGVRFAKYDRVNFPDDDCEFTPELLAEVARRFTASPGLDALFARAIDPVTGQRSVIEFSNEGQWVSAKNLYSTTVEFTMFIKKAVLFEVGLFDPDLGVGTYYGAEEGADFVLRALAQGKRLYFDPALLIYHPYKIAKYDASEQLKAYNYGKGFGRLSVKHFRLYRTPGAAVRFLYYQCRAACAAALYFGLAKPGRSKYYWNMFAGRMVGAYRSWNEFRKPQGTADSAA